MVTSRIVQGEKGGQKDKWKGCQTQLGRWYLESHVQIWLHKPNTIAFLPIFFQKLKNILAKYSPLFIFLQRVGSLVFIKVKK
jgi:hypothetical protein